MTSLVNMHGDGRQIIEKSIQAVLPDRAVCRALKDRKFSGKVVMVAVGKAAWQMAKTAYECLGDQIAEGVIVTKYGHIKSPVSDFACYEGGHPVPDENSFRGTQAALDLVQDLTEEDTVIFLLSGGGSALFEKPLIPQEELQDITRQLLASGADIVECNMIRKRLSAIKGGRFAKFCAPAHVFSVILSDIVDDSLDMIASGPAVADTSTCAQARAVVDKYGIKLSDQASALLDQETPKSLDNVEYTISGNVKYLCRAAADACRELGYEPTILTDQLGCEAKEAGAFMAAVARTYAGCGKSMAFVAGGETIVRLTGQGKGGRNQELALSAAEGIRGLENVVLFSVGSDGTDGPTDAAGGIVDGSTAGRLEEQGIRIHQVLEENDSYEALAKVDGLIYTGPTGTNVNDVAVLLIGA